MFLTALGFWRRAAAGAAFAALAATPARADGGFVSPGAGEALAPGAIVEVRWTSPCGGAGDREVDEAEVVLSLDGGRTFPIRVTPELKPCATRFLWKVPALPAEHARLALRAGAEERAFTESLQILSADFRILPDRDGRVEELRRRLAEWWIPSQPAVLSAEDLLERTLSAPGEAIGVAADEGQAAIPTSSPSVVGPERVATHFAPARLATAVFSSRAPARMAGAPTPLRL